MRAAVAAGAARAVLAALLLTAATTAAAASSDPEALDDEVESAPFAVVVEHSSGWRCGGALVSLRTALSSGACARGRGRGRGAAPPAELWARAPQAPAADGARRVARIAIADDLDTQDMTEHEQLAEEGWLGAVLDVALLELEAPFGAGARVRPILMAAAREECAGRGPCDVVRTPPASSAPLRLAAVQRAPPAVCTARAPHWAAVADKVLCFTGPQFCPSDWGVGVVCSGKLCGVLSRSVRSAAGAEGAAGVAGAAPEGCGDTHAAQLVPAWRAFVHCAQTVRSCGRDSCAAVCSEYQLLTEPWRGQGGGGGRGQGGGGVVGGGRRHEGGAASEGGGGAGDGGGGGGGGGEDGGGGGGAGEAIGAGGAAAAAAPDTMSQHRHYHTPEALTRTTTVAISSSPSASTTRWARPGWRRAEHEQRRDLPPPLPPTRTRPTPQPATPPLAPGGEPTLALRAAQLEFEPNRADFKMGEYGDNAANYDSGEEAPTRSTASAEATPAAQHAADAPAPALLVPRNATPAPPDARDDPVPLAALRPRTSSAVIRLPTFLNILVSYFSICNIATCR